jgi:uncharacterized protein involved in response to NO
MAITIKIQSSPAVVHSAGFALWQLGFRPFYLLAAGFAALSIPLWALQFSGWLTHSYLEGSVWHAHEMLFGFALAVIVGFLFTAGRNWSNRPTPAGARLAALAGLWIAGRVLVLTPYAAAAAIVNVAFPVLCAIALAVPFVASRNRRNYFFVALLLLMSVAELTVHLDRLGLAMLPGWLGIQVALDAVLFIMCVMAGRVLPLFTNSGIPGAGASRIQTVDIAALVAVLLLLGADAMQLHGPGMVLLTAVAALSHLGRWTLWRPWKTLGAPLVWILHVAYVWIPVHLCLRAFAEMGWVSPSTAIHALTVGAAGGLTVGMMARTSKGHTGRALLADRWDTACFVLVSMAALVRVLVPQFWPQWTIHAVLCSAALWSGGFGLFAVRYWAVLTRGRADGRPG